MIVSRTVARKSWRSFVKSAAATNESPKCTPELEAVVTQANNSTGVKRDLSNSLELEQPRFFDSRERYNMFVNSTSEKWQTSRQVINQLPFLNPSPPSLNFFDAGLGDASVLSRVLRGAHGIFPHVPFLVVAKEISIEDCRLALNKFPDRFSEHPQLVMCITNMFMSEAPMLLPKDPKKHEDIEWIEMSLRGNTAFEFERQIEEELRQRVDNAWHLVEGKQGPIYDKPCVIVIYREDQRFVLDAVRPQLRTNAEGGTRAYVEQVSYLKTTHERRRADLREPKILQLSVPQGKLKAYSSCK